jgi:hypothetical protein
VNPGPLSGPPGDLAVRRVDITEFDQPLFRTHGIHRNPIYYGTARRYRFDAPDGTYGVLYAGVDPHSAFIESVVKNPDNRVVTTSELKILVLAQIKANRPLRLVDLCSSGALKRACADARLYSGDRDIAQLWSKAFHDHPTCPDGILYPSRLDPTRQSVAIFGDRKLKLVELGRSTWYAAAGPQRKLLGEIAELYDVELIEDRLIAPRKPIAAVAKPGVLDL